MKAHAGDRLVIKGHRIYEPDREARVLEVRGPDGEPPYRVRWSDSGRETLLYPGVDARIEHAQHRPAAWALEVLGRPSRSRAGAPTLTVDEVTRLVRRHIELETLRTSDYDADLWALWQEEVGRAAQDARNAEILDRVLERIRQGE